VAATLGHSIRTYDVEAATARNGANGHRDQRAVLRAGTVAEPAAATAASSSQLTATSQLTAS